MRIFAWFIFELKKYTACIFFSDPDNVMQKFLHPAPRAYARGGFGVNPPPLNLLCYKHVITYEKEFVYVFVHFLLV